MNTSRAEQYSVEYKKMRKQLKENEEPETLLFLYKHEYTGWVENKRICGDCRVVLKK